MSDIVDWLSATRRRVVRSDNERALELRRTYDATLDDVCRASGEIVECVPYERLVLTWRWDHEATASRLAVRLEPSDTGTLLQVEQTDVTAESADGYAAGWHAHLAGLAAHIDGTEASDADWEAEFSLARSMIQRR